MINNTSQINNEGYKFVLKATDERHIGGLNTSLNSVKSSGNVVDDFASLFQNAINSVNQKQVDADNMIVQAGTRPDSVDVADVMNTIAEAELSLSLTKAVIDRAVRAYQEITTAR